MHDYNDKQDKKLSANMYYKYTKSHELLYTGIVTRKIINTVQTGG